MDIQALYNSQDFQSLPPKLKRKAVAEILNSYPDFQSLTPQYRQKALNEIQNQFPDPIDPKTIKRSEYQTVGAVPIKGYEWIDYQGRAGLGKSSKALLDEIEDAGRALGFKVTVSSASRPGAITKSGNPSRHGDDRALDISHVNGQPVTTQFGRNYANKLYDELTKRGYTAGEKGSNKGIIWAPKTGNIGGDHTDHLHVSLPRGGQAAKPKRVFGGLLGQALETQDPMAGFRGSGHAGAEVNVLKEMAQRTSVGDVASKGKGIAKVGANLLLGATDPIPLASLPKAAQVAVAGGLSALAGTEAVKSAKEDPVWSAFNAGLAVLGATPAGLAIRGKLKNRAAAKPESVSQPVQGAESVPVPVKEKLPQKGTQKPGVSPAEPEQTINTGATALPPAKPRPVEEATGLANQVQAREAEAKILSEVEPTKGKSPAHWQGVGRKLVDDGQDYEVLAHQIANKEVELTGDRVGVLLEGKRQLVNAVNARKAALDANPGDKGLRVAYEESRTRLDEYVTNVQAGKGRWSDVGRALQAGTELDTGNYAEVLAEARRTGSNVNEEQLQRLTSQVAERDERIAALEGNLRDIKADRAIQRLSRERRTRQSIENIHARREEWKRKLVKTTKAQAGIDPEQARAVYEIAKTYVEEGITRYQDVVAKVAEDIGWKAEDVTAHLAARMSERKEVSELQKQMRELKGQAGAETRIADLKRQIETREFERPTPREKSTNVQLENLRAERDFWSAKVRQAIKTEDKVTHWMRAAASTVRGLKLGSDVGVLMRQGLFGWGRLLKGDISVLKATKNAARHAFSERSMIKHERQMMEEKWNGQLLAAVEKKAGMQTTDHLINPEEVALGRFLSKIPIVGPVLDRFQHIFINDLRRMMFRPAVKAGHSPEELAERARFINTVTGRGNLQHVPAAMEAILTSPRYEASRWELAGQIMASPKTAVRALKNPAARANVTDLGATAGLVYLLYKGAEVAGYEIEWNPDSADFLKVRKGKEVWDVSAGMAPRIRDVLRLWVWGTDPRYGKTAADVIGTIAVRPISPAIRTPVEQASMAIQRRQGVAEKDVKSPFTGYEPGEDEKGWRAWMPLVFNSFYSTVTEEKSVPKAVSAGFREFIGTGVSRYPKPQPVERR